MFSRAVGREGRCRQISLVCVGSTRSVPATLGLPLLMCVCFPRLHCSGFSLLYREQTLSCVHFPSLSHSDSCSWVLHKGPESVGPAFSAFPVRAAQTTRSLTSALSPGAACIIPSAAPVSLSGCAGQVCLVSLLGS